MEKVQFKLKENEEFIELTKLLKIKNIAQTGGHAKLIVEDGYVFVNGEQEFRKRMKLRKNDIITLDDIEIKIV